MKQKRLKYPLKPPQPKHLKFIESCTRETPLSTMLGFIEGNEGFDLKPTWATRLAALFPECKDLTAKFVAAAIDKSPAPSVDDVPDAAYFFAYTSAVGDVADRFNDIIEAVPALKRLNDLFMPRLEVIMPPKAVQLRPRTG